MQSVSLTPNGESVYYKDKRMLWPHRSACQLTKQFWELQAHSLPWNAQIDWLLTPSKYSENLGDLNYNPLQRKGRKRTKKKKIYQVHLDWDEICFDREQMIVWFSCK